MGWKNEVRLYRLLRKAQRALKDAVATYDKCIAYLEEELGERLTLKEAKDKYLPNRDLDELRGIDRPDETDFLMMNTVDDMSEEDE